tara:strand:+ start:37843 stop:38085 length:243 start_codon:yes stop_codon:yes gene_type:complete
MKELEKLRHEVLNLRNMKEISKNAEAKLLHKLNALQEYINYTHCCKSDSKHLFCSDCNMDLKDANGFCPKYIECKESKTK